MDYAAAVNEEIRDLSPPAPTSSRSTSRTCRRGRTPARAYGVEALNRALDGITGHTAVHICFGYAAIIHDRPSGYSFLPELATATAEQISIETAQSNLDLAVLDVAAGQEVILGVLDLGDTTVETPEAVAGRIRAGAAVRPAGEPLSRPTAG